jgi:ribosomal protein S4
LNFYTSSYQARQAINNKKIWVNNKTVVGNYYVKKGDVIFLGSSRLLSTVLFKNSLHNFFLTFVEVDYYTKTLVVLKDLHEISSEDLYLIVSHYFDLKKFRDYL